MIQSGWVDRPWPGSDGAIAVLAELHKAVKPTRHAQLRWITSNGGTMPARRCSKASSALTARQGRISPKHSSSRPRAKPTISSLSPEGTRPGYTTLPGPTLNGAPNFAEIFSLYEQGKVKPARTTTFPLARAGEALAALC